jgi:hypothetical protein
VVTLELLGNLLIRWQSEACDELQGSRKNNTSAGGAL